MNKRVFLTVGGVSLGVMVLVTMFERVEPWVVVAWMLATVPVSWVASWVVRKSREWGVKRRLKVLDQMMMWENQAEKVRKRGY